MREPSDIVGGGQKSRWLGMVPIASVSNSYMKNIVDNRKNHVWELWGLGSRLRVQPPKKRVVVCRCSTLNIRMKYTYRQGQRYPTGLCGRGGTHERDSKFLFITHVSSIVSMINFICHLW